MIEGTTRFRWRLIACCSLLVGLALTQSPGLLVPDTKIDLAVAPLEFLARAAHLWDAEGAFGQLQNQAYGYLWPMGPFFALGSLLNLEGWVVQRLWLALVMCVAFVGAAKVSRQMGVRSDLACLLAAFAYALSPRMLTTLGPISIEAWPSAVAPWVLLPLVIGAERGSPRRAAALSALAIAMVGGVNAAATAAVLPLGAIWLLTRSPGPRRRTLMIWWPVFTFVATSWWLIPLFTLGAYSPPFLDFIESADVTTIPTDLFDVMRGTSNWVPYVDTSARAGNDLVRLGFLALNSGVLLVAGLIGLTWRRTRHRLFLVTALLVGVFLVSMGHVGSVQGVFATGLHDLLDGVLAPLRNVHKFDPVVRLPLVLGLAWAVDALVAHSKSVGSVRADRVNARIQVGIVVFAAAVAALPAATGRITPASGFESVPEYWQQTADFLANDQEDGVALLLPGSMFASYVWGSPQDEPLQVLAETPWAVRNAVPLTPPGNIRMLDAIESRINQGHGSAGLAAYMRRSGISHIVVRNDVARSDDIPDPVLVHAALEASPGISQVATFGPVVGGEAYVDGDLGRALINSGWQNDSAAIEIYALDDEPSFATTSDARDAPVIVGGPENLLDLIELGLLGDSPSVLAADAPPYEIAGPVILTDGYRSVVRHFGRMHDSTSATLTRAETQDLPTGSYDYYLADPQRWSTFAAYQGVADVSASDSVSDTAGDLGNIRPGSLPYAAIDGDERTAWQSDRLSNEGHWWRVDLDGSRRVDSIEVTGTLSGEQEIVVSTDDWESEPSIIQPGATTRVPVGQQASFIKITDVSRRNATPMELSEVSIPGVVAKRTLELPELPEDVAAPDAIVLRALADHRRGCTTVDGDARCVPGRAVDGEEQYSLNRQFVLDEPREYDASLMVRGIAGDALDAVIMQGQFVTVRASSTGAPDVRASVRSALDGQDTTTWTAAPFDINPSIDLSWLSPQTIRGLDIQVDPSTAARAPQNLTLTWPKGELKVTLDETGHASFDPIKTRKLTIEVGDAEPVNSIDFTGAASLVPVGITELQLEGAGGLPLLYDDSVTRGSCGSGPEVEINGMTTRTRLLASPTELVAGVAVEARLCGGHTLSLPAGEVDVSIRSTEAFAPDTFTLTTPDYRTVGASPVASSRPGPVARTLEPTPAKDLLSTTENVNAGWRASQDGETLTGVVVDGWRQGYLADGDGGDVEISFTPDTPYRVGLLAGLVALLALAGGVLLWRRRPSNEPAPLHDRVPPALVALGLAPVAGVVLAGIGGLVVASLVAVALWFITGRSELWPRLLYPSALMPAVGAAFVRPWGHSSGWVGSMTWPHYLVVAVLSGAVAFVAVDSRRRKRP